MTDKKILGANEKYNYDLAVQYLDIVLLAPRTVRLLKDDQNFDKIINQTINIVAYYEDNYEITTTNAQKFTQAYQSLTGNTLDKIVDFNYKDASNVLDTINYITVFVKNMIGLTWEEVEKSLKPQEVQAERVEETNDRSSSVNNDSFGSEQTAAQSNPSSGFNFNTSAGNYYGTYQDDVASSIITQQANLLLNRRILSGKVFQYKTKPLVIPIVKYLIAALLILMTLLALISFAVLTTMSKNSYYIAYNGSYNSDAPYIPYPSSGWTYTFWNNWSNTYFPYQFLFFLIFLVSYSLLVFRNNKNENFKYRFLWGWILTYLLILVFITFVDSGTNGDIVFNYNSFLYHFYHSNAAVNSNPDSLYYLFQHNLKYVPYAEAVRGLQITIYISLLAYAVLLVVGIVFNPKKDYERLQSLVQQYADDIRYGRVNPEEFDSGMGTGTGLFGGLF